MGVGQNASSFLEGRHDDVIKRLNEEMNKFAEELQFEKAAVLRDRIKV